MQKQFDLQRFLDAQAKVYADVCDELLIRLHFCNYKYLDSPVECPMAVRKIAGRVRRQFWAAEGPVVNGAHSA